MLSSRLVALLALGTLAAACHESTSSSISRESTVNLGLSGILYSSGNPGVMSVAESPDGAAMYLIDAESHRTTNTGLGLGFVHELLDLWPPPAILCGGPTVAFGVGESGADRNGDGDEDDIVLAYYDRAGARIVNVGLAVTRVLSSQDLLAFDVARIESSRGVYVTEPFVHDLSSGESWSLGPVGALRVVAVSDGFVALEAYEWALGDLTHDGDETDVVPALYDVRARALQFIDLPGFYGSQTHAEHRGRWIFGAFEPLESSQLLVQDPSTGTSRRFPGYALGAAAPAIEPIVLVKYEGDRPSSWLYDADTDALTSTGLAGGRVTALGQRFVILVDERAQGADLDGNGELSGAVPVLYDPATGATENVGVAGTVTPMDSGLLIASPESISNRDWNGDGDLEDTVLFTWDEQSGELVNTRVALSTDYGSVGLLGERFALLARSEYGESRDLNGDGDRDDSVLHAYDLRSRRLTNLGLAVYYAPRGDSQALFTVQEEAQGQDLNGDGDRDDNVLFATDLPGSM